METPAEVTTAREITGARHAGIAVSDLVSKGVGFRSDGPVAMTSGANRGGKSLYSLDPDGYTFEFHERPPRVAS